MCRSKILDMNKKCIDILKPLKSAVTQPYFSNRLQIYDIIEWIINQIGPSDIDITTFSSSEEFVRRIFKLKQSGIVNTCRMIADIRAARKTLNIFSLLKIVFDDIRLAQNHSKVILLKSKDVSVAIITSQNQTRGDRFECGVITYDTDIVKYLQKSVNYLFDNSNKLDELISRNS